MELIGAYLLNRTSLKLTKVLPVSFKNLESEGWYKDVRSPKRFHLLNKRFYIDQQYYRVMVRFAYMDDGTYQIDIPIPFLITKCSKVDNLHFIDHEVFHGRKLKNTMGYLEQGIPKALIDAVIFDLENCLIYDEEDIYGGSI